MPRGELIDHDKVLNGWASGDTVEAICATVGTLYANTVTSIIAQARGLGDPRAARRVPRGSSSYTEALKADFASVKRRRILAKLPMSLLQITDAVKAYAGPVAQCRPGFHAGHSPKCLGEIGL